MRHMQGKPSENRSYCCKTLLTWDGRKKYSKTLKSSSWQFFVTFLGWLSDPFKWLSDLQQGMQRSRLESPGSYFFQSPREKTPASRPEQVNTPRTLAEQCGTGSGAGG